MNLTGSDSSGGVSIFDLSPSKYNLSRDGSKEPERFLPIDIVVGPNGKLPEYKTSGSACFDIYSAEDAMVMLGHVALIHTDLYIALPPNWELAIRPRSGLASKGLLIMNTPGTIDSDYRGEIIVAMYSLVGSHEIKKGDRIAQAVPQRVTRAQFEVVDKLPSTERGSGGFGSTGVR